VGFDAGFFQHLEVAHRGLQVALPDALDGQTHRIRAGIEDPVGAVTVVLDFQKHVAVVKLLYIFRLS